MRSLKFPSYVIYRPVFFMENLPTPWFLNGDTIYSSLDPATVLQMIAVPDIGKYAARAFTEAERLNGRELDIAGDARTLPDAADVMGRALGRTITYVRMIRSSRPSKVPPEESVPPMPRMVSRLALPNR